MFLKSIEWTVYVNRRRTNNRKEFGEFMMCSVYERNDPRTDSVWLSSACFVYETTERVLMKFNTSCLKWTPSEENGFF
jgi:hypothetical protein